MIKGFKEFIMRGNVIELAIAVVIGTAFQKVVDVVVTSIITPILNAFTGPSSAGLGFFVRSGKENTYMDFSAVINAIIVFLLTALVVYLVFVVPMNKLNERRAAKRAAAGIIEDPEPASEQELLVEIRDLLSAQQGGGKAL
ncbi:large conductance mechanosensitive channel protein MscL [Nakamurella aerolata]|uniref:Large-conductance mechanosensitive channel n=1 Tax=Nakamurella aerolata TaxID=1656892 RepID=A0A849A871_9ACTN|nr:large conductance mechanosensitive channel protein MscL [Nakamurella aerolata]